MLRLFPGLQLLCRGGLNLALRFLLRHYVICEGYIEEEAIAAVKGLSGRRSKLPFAYSPLPKSVRLNSSLPLDGKVSLPGDSACAVTVRFITSL